MFLLLHLELSVVCSCFLFKPHCTVLQPDDNHDGDLCMYFPLSDITFYTTLVVLTELNFCINGCTLLTSSSFVACPFVQSFLLYKGHFCM